MDLQYIGCVSNDLESIYPHCGICIGFYPLSRVRGGTCRSKEWPGAAVETQPATDELRWHHEGATMCHNVR